MLLMLLMLLMTCRGARLSSWHQVIMKWSQSGSALSMITTCAWVFIIKKWIKIYLFNFRFFSSFFLVFSAQKLKAMACLYSREVSSITRLFIFHLSWSLISFLLLWIIPHLIIPRILLLLLMSMMFMMFHLVTTSPTTCLTPTLAMFIIIQRASLITRLKDSIQWSCQMEELR